MNIFEKLTDDTFYEYAVRHYNNPSCMDMEEFKKDLDRIKYIKKLLTRYDSTKDIKHRLLLNHIIIMGNVFGILPTMRMLFYKCSQNQHKQLKTFFTYLKFFSDTNIAFLQQHDSINIYEIQFDNTLVFLLRNIENND